MYNHNHFASIVLSIKINEYAIIEMNHTCYF